MIDFASHFILAQAGNGAAGAGTSGGSSMMLFMIVLLFGMMYFMVWRPQKRQQKEHEDLIKSIKAGDRIKTAGGMYGTIFSVSDTKVMLEIAEKVRIEIDRASIITNLSGAKAAAATPSDNKQKSK